MRRPSIKEIAGLMVEARASGSIDYEVEDMDFDEIFSAYSNDGSTADTNDVDIDLSDVLDDEDEFDEYGWGYVKYNIQYTVTVEPSTRHTPGDTEVSIDDVSIDLVVDGRGESTGIPDEHVKMLIKYFYDNILNNDNVREACLSDAGLY